MSVTVDDQSVQYWKDKCAEREKVIATLSPTCHNVAETYENLLAKYKENEEQYGRVMARLRESEEQLMKMRKLYEPVCTEFEDMRKMYELEAECREHAEQYASEVTKENRKLKRHSELLLGKELSVVPIAVELEENDVSDSEKNYIAALNDAIAKLEEDKIKLRKDLYELHENLEVEKEKRKKEIDSLSAELKQTKKSLQQHKTAVQQLAKVSESAYREYDHLKGNYEKEWLCRDRAEKYAAQLFAEKEGAKRQSTMLLMNVASDRRLMEAMLEVENLTKKLEEQRAQNEMQVKELQEELEMLKQKESIDNLEEENLHLTEEKNMLHKQLLTLQSEYKQLQTYCKTVEKDLEEAKRPPPPPPPPPPPMLTKRLNIFGRGKKKKEVQDKLKVGGAAVNDDYSRALEEMMKRIKNGTPLKPALKQTRRPSCPDDDDGSAMSELQGILTKMKKAKSEGDLLSATSGDYDDTELGQTFRRIRKNSDPDMKSNGVSRDVEKPLPKPRGTHLSRVSEVDE